MEHENINQYNLIDLANELGLKYTIEEGQLWVDFPGKKLTDDCGGEESFFTYDIENCDNGVYVRAGFELLYEAYLDKTMLVWDDSVEFVVNLEKLKKICLKMKANYEVFKLAKKHADQLKKESDVQKDFQ